ncbi:MAG: transporter substrate-binding domain-containing protein [bacterium]|jgi:polar amino acid transport system substrate-binding protein
MKKAITVLASLFAAVTMASASLAADTLEKVKEKGVLTVGVRENIPPFSFRDPDTGRLAGVEVELAEEIAKKLGLPLKLVPVTADGRIEALHDGKVDLVAAAFTKTPDRAKVVDFSLTYFRTRQRVLAKKGTVSTLKDLERKKIAVVKGTTSERNLREVVPSATVVPLSNLRDVFDVFRKGEVDLISGDGVLLYAYLRTLPNGRYEIPPEIALAEEPYAMAVRLGDRKFLDFINGVLTDLKDSGEAEKIFAKWFQKRGAPAAASALAEPRAGGAVLRPTGTPGRFVVIALRGVFRENAEVTFYDMEGEIVSQGTVHAVYGDDVYVDATGPRSNEIGAGFGVGMGIPPEMAKNLILSRQGVLKNVKEESRKETAERQREIAADYKQEKVAREKYQEDMTRMKMQLDYQYDERYYWHGGWGYYGW